MYLTLIESTLMLNIVLFLTNSNTFHQMKNVLHMHVVNLGQTHANITSQANIFLKKE